MDTTNIGQRKYSNKNKLNKILFENSNNQVDEHHLEFLEPQKNKVCLKCCSTVTDQ